MAKKRPSNQHKSEVVEKAKEPAPKTIVEREEFFSMMMGEALHRPTFTEAQLTQVIKLEEKRIDYEQDRFMKVPPKYKLDRFIQFMILIIVCVILMLVGFNFPDYLDLAFGLVAGSIGGFGYGKVTNKE